MAGATTCLCEPRNMRLCCDKTCCSLDAGLNGNRVVEIRIKELPPCEPPVWPQQWGGKATEWTPSLKARISHIAGFPAMFCDRGPCGVLTSLFRGILLSLWIVSGVLLMLILRACFAIETTVNLSRSGNGIVHGIVIRRSGCCSWHTPVDGVIKVEVEQPPQVSDDDEAPPRLLLHYFASGAEKLEISPCPMPELQSPVNQWIRAQRGEDTQGVS